MPSRSGISNPHCICTPACCGRLLIRSRLSILRWLLLFFCPPPPTEHCPYSMNEGYGPHGHVCFPGKGLNRQLQSGKRGSFHERGDPVKAARELPLRNGGVKILLCPAPHIVSYSAEESSSGQKISRLPQGENSSFFIDSPSS